jgi:hypothetical protein
MGRRKLEKLKIQEPNLTIMHSLSAELVSLLTVALDDWAYPVDPHSVQEFFRATRVAARRIEIARATAQRLHRCIEILTAAQC